MEKTYTKFTIQEAIEYYKGDPTVMCLADETVHQIDSNTIHSAQYLDYPEPWIWAYIKKSKKINVSVLLYAPGKLSTTYYRSPILDS